MKKVAVIMGSDSDLPIAEKAVAQLKELGIEYEVRVISAHRTPDDAAVFSKNAADNGFGAIISIAGMAAHLGGVLAAYTTLPVIAVPVKSSFEGLDALLAAVQMPSGIPVATVAVGGSKNAAILAAQMLALSDESLAQKLKDMRAKMTAEVREKDAKIKAQFEE